MKLEAIAEKIFAGKWIAGYYPEDAILLAKELNSNGIAALINYLGEDYTNSKKVSNTVKVYFEIIKLINKEKLNAAISLKITQLGFCINKRTMLSNYLKIVKYAKKMDVVIWLDMEEEDKVDATISAYRKAKNYGNTGICIQSYLKRSSKDIESLAKIGARIRLVKGAYKPNSATGFSTRAQTTANYLRLMELLFKKSNGFMIATHDTRMIEMAMKLNRKYKRKVTYAMLNGIRGKYAQQLAQKGNTVNVYVPFGEEWVAFSYRRLVEQGHALLVIHSLFSQK